MEENCELSRGLGSSCGDWTWTQDPVDETSDVGAPSVDSCMLLSVSGGALGLPSLTGMKPNSPAMLFPESGGLLFDGMAEVKAADKGSMRVSMLA